MAKVLLVEDDVDVAQEIKVLLKSERYTVESVPTVRTAEDFLFSSEYDLLILDWNLPDGSGVDLLCHARRKGLGLPVLMLTSRADLLDKLEGFRAGTDDYLTKPFEGEELLCRVQALLRRPKHFQAEILVADYLTLDTGKRVVKKDDSPVHLTPKEFATLEFFFRHRNQVFSGEALLERIWESDNEATAATVVATILRLRKKIDKPGQQSFIQNVFGVGYVFRSASADVQT
jgi:DNA-binding response OmpR family regulator